MNNFLKKQQYENSNLKFSLRKKCPNTEFFWSVFFRIWTLFRQCLFGKMFSLKKCISENRSYSIIHMSRYFFSDTELLTWDLVGYFTITKIIKRTQISFIIKKIRFRTKSRNVSRTNHAAQFYIAYIKNKMTPFTLMKTLNQNWIRCLEP